MSAGAGSTWKLLGQLAEIGLLFALVVALAYYVTRFLARRLPGLGGRHLRLLEQLPLGHNRAVCLVEVAGEVLVLGVTEHQVSLLRAVDDPDLAAALAAGAAAPGATWPAGGGFATLLRRLGAGPPAEAEAPRGSAAPENEPSAALRESLARLRELRQRRSMP